MKRSTHSTSRILFLSVSTVVLLSCTLLKSCDEPEDLMIPTPIPTQTEPVPVAATATTTPEVKSDEEGKTIIEDQEGDVIELDNYEIVDDQAVDIKKVIIDSQHMDGTNPLILNVEFVDGTLAKKDYSQFSLDIYLDYDGVNQRAYEYKIRDGEESLELVDGESGQVIPSQAKFQLGEVGTNGEAVSQFWFSIPAEEIPMVNEIYFLATYQATPDDPRYRDEFLVPFEPANISEEN